MNNVIRTKGVALITVMLVVSLASILAVSMSSRLQLDIHRSMNVFNFEQAYQYVNGAEEWAKKILQRDLENNQTDSLKDDWAGILPPLPIEGGSLSGELADLQARFNINNLVEDGKPQKLQLERFKRLLRTLELNEDIATVIIDWLDSNEETSIAGAEDNEYLNLNPAYRASNQRMVDVSELLLLKGVDYESYEKLLPFVCTLNQGTAINVNTASAEVITSIVNDISLKDATVLVEERNKEPYKKISDFLESPLLKQKKINAEGLSVSSKFFLLTSNVEIMDMNVNYTTIIYRESVKNLLMTSHSRSVL